MVNRVFFIEYIKNEYLSTCEITQISPALFTRMCQKGKMEQTIREKWTDFKLKKLEARIDRKELSVQTEC